MRPKFVLTVLPRSPLKDYPRDPFQLRVPDTTTTLIFSKYGPPLDLLSIANLLAKAQYALIRSIIAASGDGPVSQLRYEWTEGRTFMRIWRSSGANYLTWLMMTDTVEGVRVFFDDLRGCFEMQVTILDDTAGVVGGGSVGFE